MKKYDLKLLDCTLRDGGYINSWKWDYARACEIIRYLVKARVDTVEVGFLRNVDEYNPDITLCNRIEELNRLLPKNKGNTTFAAMTMNGSYDLEKLSDYCGDGIDLIRVTAHDYDIDCGMEFARKIKEKGYKVSINPINIMGYSDEEILAILKKVNEINPYQFSIVDTFGAMKRRDLDRIANLVDNNLNRDIRLSLHLHENMSLSCLLAQNFIDLHLNRPVAIDASLMGMGRIPGNLPIELIADYMNEYANKSYDIDYFMDAIQEYIAPLKGDVQWGYTPAYFLSAKFNLHRNYAEHYLSKGDLTNRDINHILSDFDRKYATAFDKEYADRLYEEYKNNSIDDTIDCEKLKSVLSGKEVLLIAPGNTISVYKEEILKYIAEKNPIIISVNFIPEWCNADYAFFSNNKRFSTIDDISCKTIITSNLKEYNADFKINYNSCLSSFKFGCNSLIMLLKLLQDIEVEQVVIVGADGYKINGENYYNSAMRNYEVHGEKFNKAVSDIICSLDLSVEFLTPSAYCVE